MFDNDGSWLIVDTATIDGATDVADGGGGVRLVRVIGEVDLGTRSLFEAELDRTLDRDPRAIVLDCSAMAFCGARGLAALARIAARGAEHDIHVAVVGLSPRLRRLCARFWPGPQPTPYASVTAAVDAVTVRLPTTVSPAGPA